MLDPIDIERIARAMNEPVEYYRPQPKRDFAKASVLHGWWAFCRGMGYGLARFVWKGISSMNAPEAMDIVTAWVGPNYELPGAPDFRTRCAIRAVLRIAAESHKQFGALEGAVAAAHRKAMDGGR